MIRYPLSWPFTLTPAPLYDAYGVVDSQYFFQLESKTSDYEQLLEENKRLEATIENLRLSLRKLERIGDEVGIPLHDQ